MKAKAAPVKGAVMKGDFSALRSLNAAIDLHNYVYVYIHTHIRIQLEMYKYMSIYVFLDHVGVQLRPMAAALVKGVAVKAKAAPVKGAAIKRLKATAAAAAAAVRAAVTTAVTAAVRAAAAAAASLRSR